MALELRGEAEDLDSGVMVGRCRHPVAFHMGEHGPGDPNRAAVAKTMTHRDATHAPQQAAATSGLVGDHRWMGLLQLSARRWRRPSANDGASRQREPEHVESRSEVR